MPTGCLAPHQIYTNSLLVDDVAWRHVQCSNDSARNYYSGYAKFGANRTDHGRPFTRSSSVVQTAGRR
jgi:hypothetical protein